MQRAEKCSCKIRLHQRFSAGQRHASAAAAVKHAVAQDGFEQGVDADFHPRRLERMHRTHPHARPAADAVRPCDRMLPVYPVAVPRACLHAASAADADGVVIQQRRPLFPALRVVAPHTVQRAALQKNSRPDPRPVVNAVPLDIQNTASSRLHPIRSLVCRPLEIFDLLPSIHFHEVFAVSVKPDCEILIAFGVYHGRLI